MTIVSVTRRNDAGLYAVARLLDVRACDTRPEVADADQARERAVQMIEDLRRALDAPVPHHGSMIAFVSNRTAIAVLADSITQARVAVAAAEARSADALARWQEACAQLATAEGLDGRRAGTGVAELRRTESREIDDITEMLRESARSRRELEGGPEQERPSA